MNIGTPMHVSLDTFWALSSFVFGSMLGSFLNVVICRMPEGRSVVFPPSHCPVCGAHIRFYDNIPILSYLFLRARCRDCAHPISIRYPVIELITACLSTAIYFKFGPTPAYAVFMVLCAALVAIFWIDLDHMIIPDVISLNGIPVGMACSIVGWIPEMDWFTSITGFLLGGAILYVPAILYEKLRGVEGLGGGDIKLLAMMGTFIGPYGVVFVLTVSSLLGSIVGLCGMLFRGASSTTHIPFGPFLTASAVLYIFAGPAIGEWAFLVLGSWQVFLSERFLPGVF
ncbi:MAG: prepilin peptidase [Thermodesulfobacteriota bacterium]